MTPLKKTWTTVAGVATAIILIGGAWTNGSNMLARTFLATDAEVDTAVAEHELEVAVSVGIINARVADHESHVDPQLVELAGAVEILAKGQAQQQFNSIRFQISQKDQQLYVVRQRLPNHDAKARELRLVREIQQLTVDLRRAECSVARANNPHALC